MVPTSEKIEKQFFGVKSFFWRKNVLINDRLKTGVKRRVLKLRYPGKFRKLENGSFLKYLKIDKSMFKSIVLTKLEI